MRRAGWAIILVVTLGLSFGLIAWVNWEEWFPLKKKVSAFITRDDPSCPAEMPLGITLTNNSRRQLGAIEFEVSVSRSGYSSQLESEDFSTDKIISPGGDFRMCVEKPKFRMLNDDTMAGMGFNIYARYRDDELEYAIAVTEAKALK